jgi:hypothetical protein
MLTLAEHVEHVVLLFGLQETLRVTEAAVLSSTTPEAECMLNTPTGAQVMAQESSNNANILLVLSSLFLTEHLLQRLNCQIVFVKSCAFSLMVQAWVLIERCLCFANQSPT